MMSCACFLWGGRSCWNWVLVGVVCGLVWFCWGGDFWDRLWVLRVGLFGCCRWGVLQPHVRQGNPNLSGEVSQ